MSDLCANCEKSVAAHAQYCSACGQNINSVNRPFWKTVADTLHESLDIDGRLFLTLKTLVISPGKITYDYNRGKRQTYTPPLRMYLVISILFFLFIAQFDTSPEQSSEKIAKLYDYLAKMMVILLPVFALLLQLMFRGTYYISNLIFSVHIQCFGYLCMTLLLPLETFEILSTWVLVLQLPIAGYLIYYIAKAIKINYQQSWIKTNIKTFILIIIYVSLVLLSLDFSNHYLI